MTAILIPVTVPHAKIMKVKLYFIYAKVQVALVPHHNKLHNMKLPCTLELAFPQFSRFPGNLIKS